MDLDRLLGFGADQLAPGAVSACIFAAIAGILRKRGPRVVASACLFVASLVSTQLLMRQLSSPPLSYKQPGFVTAVHFLAVWFASTVYWSLAGDITKCWPSSVGSSRRFVLTVFPIAISNPLTVVLNNKALVYVGAGLCAVVGTLSPVAVALLARVFGRTLSCISWAGVFVAFMGALLIARYEARDFWKADGIGAAGLGLSFALMSVLTRSFKIVLMDHLVAPSSYQPGLGSRGRQEQDLSPMHVYALQAPWSAVVSVAFALATESPSEAWQGLTSSVGQVVGFTCVSAVALNFLGIFVLRDLGASMQQIIGKLNTICTMALSVGLLGEQLPSLVLVGSLIVLSGVALFEHGKQVPGIAAKDLGDKSPTSVSGGVVGKQMDMRVCSKLNRPDDRMPEA